MDQIESKEYRELMASFESLSNKIDELQKKGEFSETQRKLCLEHLESVSDLLSK